MTTDLSERVYDVIVIGSGAAGMTAAIYGARAGLDMLLIEKECFGGQAARTHCIANYPGFPDGVSGYELMEKFHEQVKGWDVLTVSDEVVGIEDVGGSKKVHTKRDLVYHTKTAIIATGAEPRHLGVKGEEEFFGNGVSYCGTCDGPLYKDKNILVVGGGNSAFQEALLLARYACHITLIHYSDSFSAQQVLVDAVKETKNIDIITNCELKEIYGDDKVNSVLLYHNQEKREEKFPIDGVFIFVGIKPGADFYKDAVKCDKAGFITITDEVKTSMDGVFAAGDVISKDFRQIANAVGEGATALHCSEHYLS